MSVKVESIYCTMFGMSKSRPLLSCAQTLCQFEASLSSLSCKNTLDYQQPITSEFASVAARNVSVLMLNANLQINVRHF
jgi:hypothetical protein